MSDKKNILLDYSRVEFLKLFTKNVKAMMAGDLTKTPNRFEYILYIF